MIFRKTHLIAALALSALAFNSYGEDSKSDSDYPDTGMIPKKTILHVGIIVHDIDASINHWVAFLGLKEKPGTFVASGDSANPTHYHGRPSDAKAKLAFISLDNIQLELIEPIGDEKSNWHDFLETKGEGVHHIAFEVNGIGEKYVENYEERGFPIIQQGGWETGEYGYADSMKSLGVMIELIENYGE